MANAFRISNVTAKRLADSFDDEVNVGAQVASMRILNGAQPADPDTAETGTLGAEILFAATAFGGATDAAPGGLLTLAGVPLSDASADNAIDPATYFRIRNDNSGTPDDVADGSVGTATSDLILNTTAITAGSIVTLNSMTVTMPEA